MPNHTTRFWLLGYWLIVCLCGAPTLFASQVIKVKKARALITHGDSKWKRRDRLCIYRSRKKVACGFVLKTTDKYALILYKGKKIRRGDQARKIQRKRRSSISTAESTNEDNYSRRSRKEKIRNLNLTVGLNAGLSLLYPTLGFQYSPSPHFALGIRPHYFILSSGNSDLNSYGGYVTLNYYKDDYFEGLWGQLGGGFFLYDITSFGQNESLSSVAGLATLGWRIQLGSGFNFSIGGGVQYIANPSSTLITVDFDGFRPVLVLDGGIAF